MKERGYKYWDDFQRRIKETVKSVSYGTLPPIRRVSVFITNKCNFRCQYCNMLFGQEEMSEDYFSSICNKYKNAIIHITGGEPSTVSWLYKFIDTNIRNTIHLNTNGFICPPKNIKRLKVSLDTYDRQVFKKLCGVDAFDKVVKHIKNATKYTIVSITFVLNKQTYKYAPEFMKFCRKEFPKLYAVFFSIYKGGDDRFILNNKEANNFWENIRPKLISEMDEESKWLFLNTSDDKKRLLQGERFPENRSGICYLSLSERVYSFNGKVGSCSHLYRDNIDGINSHKNPKCLYGCNKKLIRFNEEVAQLILIKPLQIAERR